MLIYKHTKDERIEIVDIFDFLSLIGGLCLFLFGMNIMGDALERRAGNSLKSLLGKFTSGKVAGFLTGLGITDIIQSSSATTVMVVGFVNSGLMSLKQAINVIMGANVGTTVTAWILSLGGIDSGNLFVKLLKPTSFTPILALIGIIYTMFSKNTKKKDTGLILLGFATLMFGMDTMSAAVSGLRDVPQFQQLFILFTNPILGVIAGAILTAIIQSSSASVGILQALTSTGGVTYGSAIPIIMGQNIGTCITAVLSSFGANRNGKRAALVHLMFNIIGTLICLVLFYIIKITVMPAILNVEATYMGIAVTHSIFNVFCTICLFGFTSQIEKLVCRLIPDAKTKEEVPELDERLLSTPSIAIKHCHDLTTEMAKHAICTLKDGISSLFDYSDEIAEKIHDGEEKTDHYEDIIGDYLVKLSSHQISEQDSGEAAKLLKIIGDLERISDHGVNVLESAQEMKDKNIEFTPSAIKEIKTLTSAVNEILDLTLDAFINGKLDAVNNVEPLEQIIDNLKEYMRESHIKRLQQGECGIEAGFVWSDLLTNLERTSDHCSNIVACMVDMAHNNMNLHESLRNYRLESKEYKEKYNEYSKKYAIINN